MMGRGPGLRALAATFVTLGLAYGVWYAYSVFLVALLREFGWSRTVLSGAFSVFTLVHGAVGPLAGALADRVGPRRLTLAGGTLLTLGLVLDGSVSQPLHLYGAFGLVTAVGVAAAGWVPAVVLVQRWFPQRVGTALGATSAGIGAGIFLVVPACQALVELVGWRWAFRVLGAAIALWVIPATLWLVREPPAPAPAAPPARAGTLTPRAAARTPEFWMLAAAQGAAAFVNQMLLVHQVAFLVDHAVTPLVAASVVGVVGLASVAGKVGGGWVSDRIGRAVTYTVGMALVAAAVGVLAVVAHRPVPLLAYGYGLLVGVGYAVTAPLLPALVNDLFRGPHFGAIFGLLHVANALGGSLGPWVAGRVHDAWGTYAPAFAGGVAAGLASVAAVWTASARRRGRRTWAG
jgi:MFS family permease